MAERRILIVEDDVLIGMMLVDMFDALGLPEPAQATSTDEALALIASEPLAGALVDINLGEEKGWPVADALAARGVPFAFTSGGGDVIPAEHASCRLISKPFRIGDIETALRAFGV
ncbi:response regulator [Sphingopyxis alaskensis]|jgi:DNA-binding response OmpR family regulator|uniref:Response regulator receiver protein n=1 Tax=Sphingopyxis alaskensis (strain DSM 13593 / LMG 18877 / RB2256) TaxID=317655 RepID=Q1GSD3_SPHAL|nr:response regulator [Sphingopyxis alaskensis]ABF53439.1 response regulator receiver protein [Sphingopyxis alaskensis RB2256]MCM3419880.1 response regulator [Sphingopyxis alaskensis]